MRRSSRSCGPAPAAGPSAAPPASDVDGISDGAIDAPSEPATKSRRFIVPPREDDGRGQAYVGTGGSQPGIEALAAILEIRRKRRLRGDGSQDWRAARGVTNGAERA